MQLGFMFEKTLEPLNQQNLFQASLVGNRENSNFPWLIGLYVRLELGVEEKNSHPHFILDCYLGCFEFIHPL